MDILFTPSNIMFVLGFLGVIFTIYHYFKNPQIKMEKEQAVFKKKTEDKDDILELKSENKDNILALKVEWEKEANHTKFNEMGIRIDAVLKTAQNHIHTIDTKVESLGLDVKIMSNEITKLTTIIHERIPKK